MTQLKTASVLAFERKIDPSDAVFFGGKWNHEEKFNQVSLFSPIRLREKAVRGTISNRLKTKEQDPAKIDNSIQSPNLQTVDVAALAPDQDTLKAVFTVRVLPGVGRPSACNDQEYEKHLTEKVNEFLQGEGIKDLARRYAWNIANGRFLWRNRLGAQEVLVRASLIEGEKSKREWEFSALDYSLTSFDETQKSREDKLEELAAVFETALRGGKPALIEVEAFARVGKGQEVFPSQELVLDGGGRGKKGRVLYEIELAGNKVAGMHSQKIGNALRTIDTWYPDIEKNDFRPISVDPYGAVTVQGKAWRQPQQKKDFYSLLDGWLIKEKTPSDDERKFVMATLIRGGVFGDSGKE